jgi:hypothetical protein
VWLQRSALAHRIRELEEIADAARRSEEAMRSRYLDLDVFKLDIIARELKAIEKSIGRVKGSVVSRVHRTASCVAVLRPVVVHVCLCVTLWAASIVSCRIVLPRCGYQTSFDTKTMTHLADKERVTSLMFEVTETMTAARY